MKSNLAGKKLLILGGRPAATTDIIHVAQGLGVYTIVTDNLPNEHSPAKLLADEAWDISTADIDLLAKKVTDREIDGVFTGAHEFNLQRTKELCEKCGLPFYATDEQLELNFNKQFFKEKCRQAGLDVPRSFDISAWEGGRTDAVSYPVIVKPLDGNGGRGITICWDEDSLRKAIPLARKYSESGRVIAEEYVIGREITAVYTIKQGEASLSCFRDRYPTEEFKYAAAQYDLSLIPSRYTQQFWENVHPRVIRLLKSVDAQNGCVFFQGIASEQRIVLFECGYRLNALCDYHNIAQLNGINYLEMMIHHALTGEMGPFALSMDNPFPTTVSAIFNMTAHGGVIGKLSGIEKVRELENVICAEFLHQIGDEIMEGSALSQSVFRANIFGADRADLEKVIHQIQSLICVENTEGKNMLFCPFDTDRLYRA